jgi:triphosphoribosyl-dephospho-CoA synthase
VADMNLPFLAQTACIWEATARKVGNVHPGASFADLEYLQFVLSANAMAGSLQRTQGWPLGKRILDAVTETRNVVHTNTNLGIIMLIVPLLDDVDIRQTTIDDCKDVYRAIRLSQAGGMGHSEIEDIRQEPTTTLWEAMGYAEYRDAIARQYTHNFVDIHEFGVPLLLDQLIEFGNLEAAIISTQLHWLAEFPDTLITRKCRESIAIEVRNKARNVLKQGGLKSAEGRKAGVQLDHYLRSEGNQLNPGTTADLIAACLFVALRDNSVTVSAPFRWQSPDWL